MGRDKITVHLPLVADTCLSITAVALFSTAYAGDLRIQLWENGGAEGWNSDPKQRVYYYADYREPPEIPLIWSQRLTDGNLGVALLALLFALARIVMSVSGQMTPIFSSIYDFISTLAWLNSVIAQASGDVTDPEHPSAHPWYLTRSCATACRVSQASFVVSILMVILCGGRLVLTTSWAVREHRAYREGARYEMILTKADLFNDSDDVETSAARLSVEDRERIIYREALSPVLAFFPEDAR